MSNYEQIGTDHVRQALEHLYENLALAQEPLGNLLPDVAALQDVKARPRRLRSILLQAIELLQPARQESFGSKAARSYQTLNLRYVEGMTVAGIAEELGIGERQAYRDLHQALEELTQILRTYTPEPSPEPRHTKKALPASSDALGEEMARLVTRPHRLDPAPILDDVLAAVAPLATRLGTALEYRSASGVPPISADEGVLRQVMTQMLSIAAQSAHAVAVTLAVDAADRRPMVRAEFAPDRQPPKGEQVSSLQRLAERHRFRWSLNQGDAGQLTITLGMPLAEPQTILIIEDNQGAIELYRRYLSQSQGYDVVGVIDPRATLAMASHLRPSAIILDIMMPGWDGWSVLQLLHTEPQTAHIPVIICSVLDDPELGAALGASVCLKKPVGQFELLAALRKCVSH